MMGLLRGVLWLKVGCLGRLNVSRKTWLVEKDGKAPLNAEKREEASNKDAGEI